MALIVKRLCVYVCLSTMTLSVQAGLSAMSANVRRTLIQAAAIELQVPSTQVQLASVRPAKLHFQVRPMPHNRLMGLQACLIAAAIICSSV